MKRDDRTARLLSVTVDDAILRRVKSVAALERITIQEAVNVALREWVDSKEESVQTAASR